MADGICLTIALLSSKEMPYTSEQIRKRVSERRGGDAIDRAKLHQMRLKFHTVKRVSSYGLPYYGLPVSQFLAMVDNLLPHDKAVIFKTLFRFPIKTNEITGTIFDKLSRIFDGRNASYVYQFVNIELRTDWEQYRAERLHEPSVWQTKGWEFFKTEINSVLVVDLPMEQRGERPEPYFYWLPITSVLAFEADRDTGVMKFIAFSQRGRVVVLDDGFYRVWDDPKGTGVLQGEPAVEIPHDLGYCPARFFWNESISLEDPDVKASPLSGELESLDWFEFFHISKRQLDLYGAYPILSGYEQACDYSNAENGDYCDGGFLRDRQGHYKLDAAGLLLRCPKCGNKRVVGAGSFVEIPIPNETEHVPDLKDPVKMLTVDRNALDYNVEEEKRLRDDIITAVVGQDEIVTDRDAFNEQQVRANFESVTTVLNRVKKGFEAAWQWVDETVCRLRYGRYFISASINLGTEFYLYTPDELRNRYKAAKEAGSPESDLDAMLQQVIETEYRSDPVQLKRMLVLSELEPYRHLTKENVIELHAKGLVDEAELQLKLDFANFVRRFEREQANVLTFGEALDYDKKINAIRDVLLGYAKERIRTQPITE